MFRALTILAAVAALAVSAAPASAGSSNQPPSLSFGAGKDRGWFMAPPKPPQSGASGFTKVLDRDGRFMGFKDGIRSAGAARVINNLSVKYT